MSTARFRDSDVAFPVIQTPDGALFVTESTYVNLQRAGHIDGGPTASDEAPVVGPLHVDGRRQGVRDVSEWELDLDAR